jgi:hypothetical protein
LRNILRITALIRGTTRHGWKASPGRILMTTRTLLPRFVVMLTRC